MLICKLLITGIHDPTIWIKYWSAFVLWSSKQVGLENKHSIAIISSKFSFMSIYKEVTQMVSIYFHSIWIYWRLVIIIYLIIIIIRQKEIVKVISMWIECTSTDWHLSFVDECIMKIEISDKEIFNEKFLSGKTACVVWVNVKNKMVTAIWTMCNLHT